MPVVGVDGVVVVVSGRAEDGGSQERGSRRGGLRWRGTTRSHLLHVVSSDDLQGCCHLLGRRLAAPIRQEGADKLLLKCGVGTVRG